MKLRGDDPRARVRKRGARWMCLLLPILCVFPACQKEPGEEEWSIVRVPEPEAQPLTEAQKVEANRLLQKTALLRRNEGHPEWERWTADDLSLDSRDVGAWHVTWRPGTEPIEALGISYVHREEKGHGFSGLYLSVGTEDEVIRRYLNPYARSAAERDEREQGAIAATLTCEEATRKAREYVRSMMGGFPGDLVLEELYYGSGTPFWYATFTRYEGWIPYLSQDVKLVFSERYGVAEYSNSYLDRWEGTIRISPGAAIKKAQTQKKRVDRKVQRAGLYLEAGRPSFVLRRPPRILSGHPYLMHVVKDKPREVHAVWNVAFPFQWLSDDSPASEGRWDEILILIDAETGEVLPD